MLFLVKLVYSGISVHTLENEESWPNRRVLECWSEMMHEGAELERLTR